MCVGEFMYEFIKSEDKLMKMNVVSRSSSKSVYYCGVESEVGLLCMQRNKNLMVSYDDQNNLNFWRQIS